MPNNIEHASPIYWKRSPEPHESFRNYSLLFVDDEKELLEVFREAFGRANAVFTALTGTVGLAVLEKQDIDVVLLDLHMPGTFDGIQTLALIKQKYPYLPVVVYSAYLDIYNDELAPADEFIQKPIDIAKLAAVLKYYAELSRFKKTTPD